MLESIKKKKDRKFFGELAVMNGLITEDQVTEALNLQEQYKKEQKIHKKIGAVLIEKGFLTPEDVKKVLKYQNNTAGFIAWFTGLFTLSR